MKYIFSFLFTLFVLPCHALVDCQDHLQKWLSEAESSRSIDRFHATCKVWPMNPDFTIAAWPIAWSDNQVDQGVYDLDVVIADTVTGVVLSRLHQASAISYDAVQLKGISIDTGQYKLTQGKRAFGVRISYASSSGISLFSITVLNLYMVHERELFSLFDNFIAEDTRGEWDGQCSGLSNKTLRYIDFARLSNEELPPLMIYEKKVSIDSKMVNEKCISSEVQKGRTNFSIGYRRGGYPIPKDMKYIF